MVTPITEVDDVRQRMSLVMDLQEGPPYRVGKIEVPGPDPRMESLLKSKLKRGDIFDPKLVEDFYKKNKSFLPADASPADNQLHTDVRNGRVDLVFDFRNLKIEPCVLRTRGFDLPYWAGGSLGILAAPVSNGGPFPTLSNRSKLFL